MRMDACSGGARQNQLLPPKRSFFQLYLHAQTTQATLSQPTKPTPKAPTQQQRSIVLDPMASSFGSTACQPSLLPARQSAPTASSISGQNQARIWNSSP